LIFHPVLYHTFGPLTGLLVFVFCALSLAALLHTAVKTPRPELRTSGVNRILIGLLVAVVPTIVGGLSFALRLDIPGFDYLPLMLMAFPISLALAVRQAR